MPRGEAAGRVSTYSVVVAVHIIAAFAAYGLPLAYPLVLPYLRRHHPEALPGVHAIQYRLNIVLTGPFTIVLLAAGIYLASDGAPLGRAVHHRRPRGDRDHRRRRRRRDRPGDQAPRRRSSPQTPEYATVYRRYLAAEIFLAAVVLARDLRDGGQAVLVR